MRISKLESYLVILKALMDNSLTIDMLSYDTGMDCLALRQHLDFLMMNGLIEEQMSRKKKTYSISAKGIAVLNALSFKEYFTRVRDPLVGADETVQLSRVSKKKDEP